MKFLLDTNNFKDYLVCSSKTGPATNDSPAPKPLRKQPENTIKAARDVADRARQRLAHKDTAIEVDSDQI
jgi:hypothetical protein